MGIIDKLKSEAEELKHKVEAARARVSQSAKSEGPRKEAEEALARARAKGQEIKAEAEEKGTELKEKVERKGS